MGNYDPWEDQYDGGKEPAPDVAYQLLAVLQRYAPDSEAQARCTDYLARMQRDGATTREVALAMTGALMDGLRHGNWIWKHVPPHQRDGLELRDVG
jgi:hypothetical protein